MTNILILAGTTEGRQLAEKICKSPDSSNMFFISVATEYGKSLLPEARDNLKILADRMSEKQMGELIELHNISLLVDATHPYAQLVSENAQNICLEKDIRYVRLLRKEETIPKDAIIVKDSEEAASFLIQQKGNVLLCIGSKELKCYINIPDYKHRLYPRILPIKEMIENADSLGFDAGHLICMKGPFSYDMNLAMLKHIGATWLVTKESGRAGGFVEKVEAAKDAGVKLVVIGRPTDEKGAGLEEVFGLCGISSEAEPPKACSDNIYEPTNADEQQIFENIDIEETENDKSDWFPFFTNIKNKNVLVVGGGTVATRRVVSLIDFSCKTSVVAKKASERIQQAEEVVLIERAFSLADLEGRDLVIAATDDDELNKKIADECKRKNILVNVASSKEDCDFFFPGIVKHSDLIIGVATGGKNPFLASEAIKTIGRVIKKEI